jgi:hypothetical protein
LKTKIFYKIIVFINTLNIYTWELLQITNNLPYK